MAEVASNPTAELAVNNGKFIKNCTELHMANKGITVLRGFGPFVNLEVLWLNGNRIRKIKNLDSNVRIKRLYLHDNCITTLKGSLSVFPFLSVLTLQNNKLKNLELCLEHLVRCRYLKQLDLRGNPVAEENHYRLNVIGKLPWLETFDCSSVTDEERRLAKRLRACGGDLAKASGGGSPKKRSMNWSENMSALTREVEKDARRVEARERRRAAEEHKKAMASAQFGRASSSGRANGGAPLPNAVDFRSRSAARRADGSQLGEWEIYALRQLFRARDGTDAGRLSADALRAVVEDFVDEGRTLDGESQRQGLDELLASLDTNEDGLITWTAFAEAVQYGHSDIPSLRWRSLEPAEAQRRADAMFDEAREAMMARLALQDGSDEAAELEAKAKALSAKANRLAARGIEASSPAGRHASTFRAGAFEEKKNPLAAGPRSDIYRNFHWVEERHPDAESPSDSDDSTDDEHLDEESKQERVRLGLKSERYVQAKAKRRERKRTSVIRRTLRQKQFDVTEAK
jgi:hypothetical protein